MFQELLRAKKNEFIFQGCHHRLNFADISAETEDNGVQARVKCTEITAKRFCKCGRVKVMASQNFIAMRQCSLHSQQNHHLYILKKACF